MRTLTDPSRHSGYLFDYKDQGFRFLSDMFNGAADELTSEMDDMGDMGNWHNLLLARAWLSAFSTSPLRNVPSGGAPAYWRHIIDAADGARIWAPNIPTAALKQNQEEVDHICHLFDVALGLAKPEPGEPDFTAELRQFCSRMAEGATGFRQYLASTIP